MNDHVFLVLNISMNVSIFHEFLVIGDFTFWKTNRISEVNAIIINKLILLLLLLYQRKWKIILHFSEMTKPINLIQLNKIIKLI